MDEVIAKANELIAALELRGSAASLVLASMRLAYQAGRTDKSDEMVDKLTRQLNEKV